ncbi:hypothetical protein SAMN02745163_00246 [Clostridium cavendishii DSM 21758]|uniref:Uncharacterized protein n=1 Tax=Clostridium cavendishii DSM 21758 TaxID=1121302 RepID=A0A1M6B3M6_9CLOT|nr:hypothetical protein [Clostridium cavendishii]SHI43267.1 hypothetical protein SAMN02745163_00246 [Clostridium cavendishii DSM 21758]
MEFRLNKIDTDLRRKLQDKTKDGKIHRKLEISIYNNGYKERKNENTPNHKDKEKHEEFKELVDKYRVTVDAIKGKTIEVEGEMEQYEYEEKVKRGIFIDTKK